MADKSNHTGRKILIGASLAAAAGYVAGVLTAPKSGKETRKDIKNKAIKTKKEAEKQAEALRTEFDQLSKRAKDKAAELSDKARKELNDALETAKKAQTKAGEKVKALKSDPKDDDLQVAINEAKSALQHLSSFLKK